MNESAGMRIINSWLDRAGLKPVNERADVTPMRSLKEVEADLRDRRGEEAFELFMQGEKQRTSGHVVIEEPRLPSD